MSKINFILLSPLSSFSMMILMTQMTLLALLKLLLSPVQGEDCLTFLLLGDWGKGGTSATVYNNQASSSTAKVNTLGGGKSQQLYQMDVARAMDQYSSALTPRPSFVVALGDNFYTEGVQSSTDSLWDSLWKDVYLGFETLNIPWYPVFGNHDYGYGSKGVQAQIDRSREHVDDDTWRLEATNYTKTFDISEQGGTVHIVYIDTTTLAPSVNKCCNEKGGVSTAEQKRRIVNQLIHIDKMLKEAVEARPTWLIVAGHYPVYSIGDDGDISELKSYLLPLLDKYNVHAYICGHDHVGEHLIHPNHSTQFFVIGAGTMITSYAKSTSEATALYFGAGYASFAVMTATPQSLTTQWVDTSGTVRYEYILTNPMTMEPTSAPTQHPSVNQSQRPSAVDTLMGQRNSTNSDNNDSRNNALTEFIQSSGGKYAIASLGGLLLLMCALLLYNAVGRSRKPKHAPLASKDSGPKHPKLQLLRAKQMKLKQYMELLEQGEVDKFNEAYQSDDNEDATWERTKHTATMQTTDSDPAEVATNSPSPPVPTHQKVHSIAYNKIREEDESSQHSSRVRSRGSTMAI